MQTLRLALWLGIRYLAGLRRQGVVLWLALISVAGVAVATAAMLVVFSAFNGLERLIRQVYRQFDPEIAIMPVRGKFFVPGDSLLEALRAYPEIDLVTGVIEDNALARTADRQMVVRLKGVTEEFDREGRLAEAVTAGQAKLFSSRGGYEGALIGVGVRAQLQLDIDNVYEPLQLLYPRARRTITLNPSEAYVKRLAVVRGQFMLERQFDERYVIVPLALAEGLTGRPGALTSLEIKTRPGTDVPRLARRLTEALSSHKLEALGYEQQHASLVRVINLERMLAFVALTVILLIASFNIFTALSMMAVRKRVELSLLQAMGGRPRLVMLTLLAVGLMTAALGAVIGLGAGVVLVLGQQRYGWVGMGVSGAVVEAYPVWLNPKDLGLVTATILVVALTVSIAPALRAGRMITYRPTGT